MPQKHRRGVALAIILAVLCQPAAASFVYNYDAAWMFDSSTGLYWQYQQIPSATFTPATGQIAQFSQLNALGQQIGMTNGLFGGLGQTSTSSYDVNLANLLSFFQSDAPADAAPYQVPLDLRGFMILNGTEFQYALLQYAPAGSQRFFWTYSANLTLGTYGPPGVCYNGTPCPPTVDAFVVSTTPPVPLPAAVWLMLSGLTVFGLRRRKLT